MKIQSQKFLFSTVDKVEWTVSRNFRFNLTEKAIDMH